MGNTHIKTTFAIGTHCVMVSSNAYSEMVDNKVIWPEHEGYQIIAHNSNSELISCNFAVYVNTVEVIADTYRLEDGTTISPSFGIPLTKNMVEQPEQPIQDIKLR